MGAGGEVPRVFFGVEIAPFLLSPHAGSRPTPFPACWAEVMELAGLTSGPAARWGRGRGSVFFPLVSVSSAAEQGTRRPWVPHAVGVSLRGLAPHATRPLPHLPKTLPLRSRGRKSQDDKTGSTDPGVGEGKMVLFPSPFSCSAVAVATPAWLDSSLGPLNTPLGPPLLSPP